MMKSRLADMPAGSVPIPLYTRTFWLLCASHVCFAASFTMIIPELPNYLTQLGGAEYKGLIIGLFTLTAGLSRPWSGKLSDTVGRMPVMVIGTLVCVLCSGLYPFVVGIGGFLWLRLIHGFSTGFKPTASTAYLADIVPADRRGEAVGILGVSFNLGASASPPFGSWLAGLYGVDIMFFASSLVALGSLLALWGMPETLTSRRRLAWGDLRLQWSDVWYRPSLMPALVVFLLYMGFGLLLTVGPDHSDALGLGNRGYYFLFFTAASLLSRLLAGRLSDHFGRVPVILLACMITGFGLLLMGFGESQWSFLGGAAMFGFTTGIAGPALMAWVIDRSAPEARGRAFGTFYIFMEFAIGSGALLSAALFDNQVERLPLTYAVFAAVSFASVALLVLYRRKQARALMQSAA